MSSPAVELQDVSIRYGRRSILHDVGLVVRHGEVVLLSGSNGSGKSSLLRVAAGACKPSTGRREGVRASYVPATMFASRMSVGSWLKQFPGSNVAPATQLLSLFGFDSQLDVPCRQLSFGNFRKLMLARAMTSDDELIVIDELSAGLDRTGLTAALSQLSQLAMSGRALLIADQDDRLDRYPPATNVRIIEKQLASVEAVAMDADVAIELRGPQSNVHELVESAGKLGFVRLP